MSIVALNPLKYPDEAVFFQNSIVHPPVASLLRNCSGICGAHSASVDGTVYFRTQELTGHALASAEDFRTRGA